MSPFENHMAYLTPHAKEDAQASAEKPGFSLDFDRLRSQLTWSRLALMIGIGLSGSLVFRWLVGTLPIGIIFTLFVGAAAIVLALGLFVFSVEERQLIAKSLTAETLCEALSEPSCVAAMDGRILAANPAWTDAGGSARRLPQGDEAPALFVALKEARIKGEARAFVTLGSFDFEMLISRLGQDLVLLRAASKAALGDGALLVPEIVASIATDEPSMSLSEPTEAQQPASAMEDPVSLFNDHVQNAPFGQAWLSGADLFDARIEAFNRAFLSMADQKKDSHLGQKFSDLIDETSREELRRRFAAKPTGPFEIRLVSDRDRPIQLSLTKNDDGFMVYLLDISELKQLEQSFAQVQKMQAIGQFAGGGRARFKQSIDRHEVAH